jgi:hypothetical protein
MSDASPTSPTLIKSSQDLRPGQVIGRWTLIEKIDGGGNADVWEARATGEKSVAIKFLKKLKDVARARFRDEVMVVSGLHGVTGILPILAHESTKDSRIHWYAMPLATPLSKSISPNAPLAEIIRRFIELAHTLATLHARSVFHRDIKPENLLVHGDRAVFSDFGIARFPGYSKLTQHKNIVGPWLTMAPEVRRHGGKPDPAPADVFSLAKSLWMILTRDSKGFEGEYSITQRRQLLNAWPQEHLDALHGVLERATAHDPASRPTAIEFAKTLEEWLGMYSNLEQRAPDEWLAIQRELFPFGVPAAAEWTDINAIGEVLSRLGGSRIASHVFMPGGGGFDITGAIAGKWAGTLELKLDFEFNLIVSPARLSFRRIDADRTRDFYLLEMRELAPPAGFAARPGDNRLEFTEFPDGRWVSSSAIDRNEWEGQPLPADSRSVILCTHGRLLFVMRTSSYNSDPSTYDGRHGSLTADELVRAFQLPARPPDPVIVGVRYVEEDLSWAANAALRPSLQYLVPGQVVRVLRKWPRYKPTSEYGLVWSSDTIADALNESSEREAAIENLLRPLSTEGLGELLALMYAGRDYPARPLSVRLWNAMARHRSAPREESLRVLTEKVEAARYIARGLRVLGAFRLRPKVRSV